MLRACEESINRSFGLREKVRATPSDRSKFHEFRRRRNERTLGRIRHRTRWADREILLLEDADTAHKVTMLAIKLERSFASVKAARNNHFPRVPHKAVTGIA